MIVVEGTDCIGKTTLCKRLVSGLNESLVKSDMSPLAAFRYQHLSALPPGWDFPGSYYPMILGGAFVVQDRFFASEVSYGNVVRGYTILDEDRVRILEGLLDATLSTRILITCRSCNRLVQLYRDQCFRRAEMFTEDVVISVEEHFRDQAASKIRYDYVIDVSDGWNHLDVLVPLIVSDATRRLVTLNVLNGFSSEAYKKGKWPWMP